MVAWPVGVNQDAYGLDISGGNNVASIEFESGKARTYLKNSSPKKIFSFLLYLDDTGATSEIKKFVTWWDDVLLSGSESFAFPDLLNRGVDTEYRMTETYSASGQKKKEIALAVEEM
jgi:hypothetical protein